MDATGGGVCQGISRKPLLRKTGGWQTVRSFRRSGVIAGDGGLWVKQTTGDGFMQKKLIAIAVAGALAPAASMAQSTVEIYGRANIGIDNFRATGGAVGANDLKSRM